MKKENKQYTPANPRLKAKKFINDFCKICIGISPTTEPLVSKVPNFIKYSNRRAKEKPIKRPLESLVNENKILSRPICFESEHIATLLAWSNFRYRKNSEKNGIMEALNVLNESSYVKDKIIKEITHADKERAFSKYNDCEFSNQKCKNNNPEKFYYDEHDYGYPCYLKISEQNFINRCNNCAIKLINDSLLKISEASPIGLSLEEEKIIKEEKEIFIELLQRKTFPSEQVKKIVNTASFIAHIKNFPSEDLAYCKFMTATLLSSKIVSSKMEDFVYDEYLVFRLLSDAAVIYRTLIEQESDETKLYKFKTKLAKTQKMRIVSFFTLAKIAPFTIFETENYNRVIDDAVYIYELLDDEKDSIYDKLELKVLFWLASSLSGSSYKVTDIITDIEKEFSVSNYDCKFLEIKAIYYVYKHLIFPEKALETEHNLFAIINYFSGKKQSSLLFNAIIVYLLDVAKDIMNTTAPNIFNRNIFKNTQEYIIGSTVYFWKNMDYLQNVCASYSTPDLDLFLSSRIYGDYDILHKKIQ